MEMIYIIIYLMLSLFVMALLVSFGCFKLSIIPALVFLGISIYTIVIGYGLLLLIIGIPIIFLDFASGMFPIRRR